MVVKIRCALFFLTLFFFQSVLEEHQDRPFFAVDIFVFAHANHRVGIHALACKKTSTRDQLLQNQKIQVSHWDKNQHFIQKFPRFWYLKNVNFVKKWDSETWILWKMRFQYCEFCEKWDFRNVDFVKNEFSDMWIL